MKKLLIALLLFTGIAAIAGGTNYSILTAESTLKFSIHNFGLPVNGTLAPPTGTMVFDETDLDSSKLDVEVQVASINTKIPLRDEHLRGPEFFEVEKFPTMHFASTSIVRAGKGFIAYGTLTIKGKSKEVGLPFTCMKLGSRAIFEGSLVINRSDYGVGKKWPPISNSVKIYINVMAGK